MDRNPYLHNAGNDSAGGSRSGDYEYDEAHDVSATDWRTPASASRHMESPPEVNLDAGGDYGYDEAHDFRTS